METIHDYIYPFTLATGRKDIILGGDKGMQKAHEVTSNKSNRVFLKPHEIGKSFGEEWAVGMACHADYLPKKERKNGERAYKFKKCEGDKVGTCFMIDCDDLDMKQDDFEQVVGKSGNMTTYTKSHLKEGKICARVVFFVPYPMESDEMYKNHYNAFREYLKDCTPIKPCDDNLAHASNHIRGSDNGYKMLFDGFFDHDTLNFYLELTKDYSAKGNRGSKTADAEPEVILHIGNDAELVKKGKYIVEGEWVKDDVWKIINAIGYIPSGKGNYTKWFACCCAVINMHHDGFFTEVEKVKALKVFCGREYEREAYNLSQLRGKDKGTDRYNMETLFVYANEVSEEYIPVRRIYTNNDYADQLERLYSNPNIETYKYHINRKHLHKEDVEAIQNEMNKKNYRKVLIQAQPGSGKTVSAVEWAVENKISDMPVLLLSPRLSLIEQLQNRYSDAIVLCSDAESLSDKEVYERLQERNRLVIATNDQSMDIYNKMKRWGCEPFVVCDEFHKLIDDYSFKSDVVIRVKDILWGADECITLSGTPQKSPLDYMDVLINVIQIDKENPERDTQKLNANHFYVHEFVKGDKGYDFVLTLGAYVVQRMEMYGGKWLLFVENIKAGQVLQTIIQKQGKTCARFDSRLKELVRNGNQNQTVDNMDRKDDLIPYNEVIYEGAHTKVDAIITTSLIDTGISIEKHLPDEKYHIGIVQKGGLSDLGCGCAALQMAHRFRFDYESINLFLMEEEGGKALEDITEEDMYMFNLAILRQKKRAQSIVEEMEYARKNNEYYKLTQRESDMYAVTMEHGYSPLLAYYNIGKSERLFYAKYLRAFQKLCSLFFHMPITEVFKVQPDIIDTLPDSTRKAVEDVREEQAVDAEDFKVVCKRASEFYRNNDTMHDFMARKALSYDSYSNSICMRKNMTDKQFRLAYTLAPYISKESICTIMDRMTKKSCTVDSMVFEPIVYNINKKMDKEMQHFRKDKLIHCMIVGIESLFYDNLSEDEREMTKDDLNKAKETMIDVFHITQEKEELDLYMKHCVDMEKKMKKVNGEQKTRYYLKGWKSPNQIAEDIGLKNVDELKNLVRYIIEENVLQTNQIFKCKQVGSLLKHFG